MGLQCYFLLLVRVRCDCSLGSGVTRGARDHNEDNELTAQRLKQR